MLHRAKTRPSTRPAAVTGERSPYPTVVMVIRENQTASQKSRIVAPGAPDSAATSAASSSRYAARENRMIFRLRFIVRQPFPSLPRSRRGSASTLSISICL